MTPQQIAQLASALIVVATPWIVVRVAFRVAHAHAPAVEPRNVWPASAVWLSRLTLASVVSLAAAALAAVAPFWLVLAAGLAFIVFSALALRSLGEIDRLSKPDREVTASVRSASLAVRRAGQYLPWKWRFVVYGVGLTGVAAFAVRVATPGADRRVVVPLTVAFAAVVFLWLYEVWIQQLVSGPATPERQAPGNRQRLIRGVFAMEVALVAGCLTAAHVLLDLDWNASGAYGAIVSLGAGVLGVVGCALALSSDLTQRRYVEFRSLAESRGRRAGT